MTKGEEEGKRMKKGRGRDRRRKVRTERRRDGGRRKGGKNKGGEKDGYGRMRNEKECQKCVGSKGRLKDGKVCRKDGRNRGWKTKARNS